MKTIFSIVSIMTILISTNITTSYAQIQNPVGCSSTAIYVTGIVGGFKIMGLNNGQTYSWVYLSDVKYYDSDPPAGSQIQGLSFSQNAYAFNATDKTLLAALIDAKNSSQRVWLRLYGVTSSNCNNALNIVDYFMYPTTE